MEEWLTGKGKAPNPVNSKDVTTELLFAPQNPTARGHLVRLKCTQDITLPAVSDLNAIKIIASL